MTLFWPLAIVTFSANSSGRGGRSVDPRVYVAHNSSSSGSDSSGGGRVRVASMNVILAELRRAGIEHETLEDVFSLAESISDACDFFRQPGESRLRVLDLAASLFDHVAAECIGDVAALNVAEGGGDVGGVGSLDLPGSVSGNGEADDDRVDENDCQNEDGGEEGHEDDDGDEDEDNDEDAGRVVERARRFEKSERETVSTSGPRR